MYDLERKDNRKIVSCGCRKREVFSSWLDARLERIPGGIAEHFRAWQLAQNCGKATGLVAVMKAFDLSKYEATRIVSKMNSLVFGFKEETYGWRVRMLDLKREIERHQRHGRFKAHESTPAYYEPQRFAGEFHRDEVRWRKGKLVGYFAKDVIRAEEIYKEHPFMEHFSDPDMMQVFELIKWVEETWRFTQNERRARQKAAARKVMEERARESELFWEMVDREAGRID